MFKICFQPRYSKLFQTPIRLQLNKTTGAYESEEFQVPVGDHACQLNVDMKDHKIEPLQIRFYTFEADIFLTGELLFLIILIIR